MYTNHKQLVKAVKDLLRSTKSVDKTVSAIVREVVRSAKSNDNVSMVLLVFNQFSVITAHAGSSTASFVCVRVAGFSCRIAKPAVCYVHLGVECVGLYHALCAT